jgi:hypothetical protein
MVQARLNCIQSGNAEWRDRHEARAELLVRKHMPSGGGFDSGVQIDLDQSTQNKLVFRTSFHHMNEVGYYDGWTDHEVIVTPDLAHGYTMRITGRNRNDIKDYMHECFDMALSTEVDDAELQAA